MKNTLSYRLIRHLMRDDKLGFAWAFFLSAIGGLVELAGVATIYPFLTLLNRPEIIHQKKILEWLYAAGRFSNDRDFIFYFGLASVSIVVFVNVFMFAKQAYLTQFSLTRTASLSVRLLRSYLHKPYGFFLDNNGGDISKNVISQADTFANAIILSWMTMVSDFCVLVALMSFVLYRDFKTGLVVMLVLGCVFGLIQYFIRNKIYDLGKRNDEANSRRFAYCLQALQSIKEIKAGQKEDFFCRLFEAPAREFANTYTTVNQIQMAPSYSIQAVAAAFIIGLAIYYLHAGMALPVILPLVSLYAVVGYRLMPSLTRFSSSIGQMRQQRSVFENVFNVLDSSVPDKPAGDASEPVRFTDKIEIKEVSFSYPGSRGRADVLDRLSFEIRPHSFVAIAGGSGAGKTTLVDVMLGLFPPKEGEITVDGRRLTPEMLSSWRHLIGYIPQSIYLLSGTIAENIAFGVNEADMDGERVRAVARMAHLDDFVDRLPDKFDARVGERGAKLSGGQRQRLAIARALYPDPKILIMDEPTSALDGITEQAIVKTLAELKREKTVIVIAHRNSTIRSSDRILLLDQGRIADSGSYDELTRRNKLFADLMSHPESERTIET